MGKVYYDLEQEADRLRLDLEWPTQIQKSNLVVLDEAQVYPEIFPRLRGTIDQNPKRMGRFLLLGSVSPALMVQVSESLAGRLSLVELTPMICNEIPQTPLSQLWCRGGYPAGGVLGDSRFPQWQTDYLTLLSQRDLPNWGLPAKPQTTRRFLKMIAAINGQVWQASEIGQSMGLSYHTVNHYLEYLIGAFLVRRLDPYQTNLRKRLVKRPKIFWRDTGLLHSLLNVSDPQDLLTKPWVGASWEGFVIEQILGALGQRDIHTDPYFLRTGDQYELDLVLDFGRKRIAVEIKLTTAPRVDDMRQLNLTADLIHADTRLLVSQTPDSVADHHQISCNLPWLINHLDVLAD